MKKYYRADISTISKKWSKFRVERSWQHSKILYFIQAVLKMECAELRKIFWAERISSEKKILTKKIELATILKKQISRKFKKWRLDSLEIISRIKIST